MIQFSETYVDFFSDSVGIYIPFYLVYWTLLHLAKGILSVFFCMFFWGRCFLFLLFLTWYTLLVNYFQLVRKFLVFF